MAVYLDMKRADLLVETMGKCLVASKELSKAVARVSLMAVVMDGMKVANLGSLSVLCSACMTAAHLAVWTVAEMAA